MGDHLVRPLGERQKNGTLDSRNRITVGASLLEKSNEQAWMEYYKGGRLMPAVKDCSLLPIWKLTNQEG